MITAALLRSRGACAQRMNVFIAEWPEGCEVSEANLLRAGELGLDLGWFAYHFLPPPLRAEYERRIAPLQAECERQIAPLRAEYERQIAPLQAKCECQQALLIWKLWTQAEKPIQEREMA